MSRIIIEDWPIECLKPDPKNPRRNDAAVPSVKESIRQFGFRVPMVIDNEGNIVAGHTRYKAAVELGISEIPCVVASGLSKKQLKAFQLADNKVGEYSSWDINALDFELNSLREMFTMSDFGFKDFQGKSKTRPKERNKDYVICPRCGCHIPRTEKGVHREEEAYGSDLPESF